MIKLILILCLSVVDGTYTIDTHNYTFIRECFSNLAEHICNNREDITKLTLDLVDLFL